MSTLAYALSDSKTMLRRNLKHAVRYPAVTFVVAAIPIVLLLMFVYVFGGTLGAGLGIASRGGDYVDYVVPGILLMAIAGSSQGTAIAVSMDMTEGIIARFRTMGITRASVMTGHVLGSTLQTMLGVAAVVAVAFVVGFRPTASPVEWIAATGVLLMTTLSITWLAVALGLLPFLSSGFVPTESMPAGVAWFAEHQPFTPIIETLRGLLLGTAIGDSAVIALAWCVGIALVSYRWALRLYNRERTR
jgi:ABC-2 type transport system permease protein